MTPLGECADYDGLRLILRARAEQLNISRLEIDRISGVANGYSATVLSETSTKQIGPRAIGPLLAALGLKLVVVEDPEAMARYTARAETRIPNMAHAGRFSINAMRRAKSAIFAELGRHSAASLFARTTQSDRIAWARAAAAKRWRQYRANLSANRAQDID